MKITLLFISLVFAVVSCNSVPQKTNLPRNLIAKWSSEESKIRLQRSINGDFFQLASYYEPQQNKLYCGPATGTILLNFYYLDEKSILKPSDQLGQGHNKIYLDKGFNPIFSKFTQNSFFNDRTESIKKKEVFFGKPEINGQRDPGLKIEQLAKILNTYDLISEIFLVSDLSSTEQDKQRLISSLKDATSFIIINFDRKVFGQNGGGHISPVVAYDQISDSFLVLDVNPVVSEWFWVSSEMLFNAMNTKDDTTYRGYIIVTKKI